MADELIAPETQNSLTRLRLSFGSDTSDTPQRSQRIAAENAAYAESLKGYSSDVVDRACQELGTDPNLTRFPSVGRILAACKRLEAEARASKQIAAQGPTQFQLVNDFVGRLGPSFQRYLDRLGALNSRDRNAFLTRCCDAWRGEYAWARKMDLSEDPRDRGAVIRRAHAIAVELIGYDYDRTQPNAVATPPTVSGFKSPAQYL